MRSILTSALFGTNPIVSGLFAVCIVALVALGCTCNRNFNLGNLVNSTAEESKNGSERNVRNDDDRDDKREVPSKEEVESLVKETISDFADAVEIGDFSDIYEKSSIDFQNTYTVDEMKEAFKSYTDQRSVVVPILRKVARSDAKFRSDPLIRKEKGLDILVAEGEFPTKPYKVRFDYEYVMRDGEWKLLKLVINIP